MPSATMPVEKASRSPRNVNWLRQEAVAGQEVGQAREVGEGGVGGQDQDQQRRELDEVVGRVASPKTCRAICETTVS